MRGSFHGLSHDTTAAHLAYAVMEGVTFGLRDGLRALQTAGCSADRLSLVGGGARSAFWAQQLSSSMALDIVTHSGSTSGGALGAARLAWLAVGGDMATVCTVPDIDRVFTPDLNEQALLAPRYEQFQQRYQQPDERPYQQPHQQPNRA